MVAVIDDFIDLCRCCGEPRFLDIGVEMSGDSLDLIWYFGMFWTSKGRPDDPRLLDIVALIASKSVGDTLI